MSKSIAQKQATAAGISELGDGAYASMAAGPGLVLRVGRKVLS